MNMRRHVTTRQLVDQTFSLKQAKLTMLVNLADRCNLLTLEYIVNRERKIAKEDNVEELDNHVRAC